MCNACHAKHAAFQHTHGTLSSTDMSAWFGFLTNWLLKQLQLLYALHEAPQGEYSQHSTIVCVSQRFVSVCLLCMIGRYCDAATMMVQSFSGCWCSTFCSTLVQLYRQGNSSNRYAYLYSFSSSARSASSAARSPLRIAASRPSDSALACCNAASVSCKERRR